MSMDLYFGSYSPPSHAVWFVAQELGIELNLKHIDLMKGEHLAPEFVKVRVSFSSSSTVIDSNSF